MPVSDDLSVALARLGMNPESDGALRPVLLSVVVDLFVGRRHHAPADIEIFAAMIGPLLKGTSPATRQKLLDRLYTHPSASPALLDRLMDDESLIEADMFQHATLSEEQLLAAAESGPAMFAAAVAQRPGLSEALVNTLLARPEQPVLDALVGNAEASFTPAQLRILVERTAGHALLAERLVPRIADPFLAAPLFPLLSSTVRSGVLDSLRRQTLGRREWGRPDRTTQALSARLDRLVLSGEWDGFDEVLCSAFESGRTKLLPLLHDGRGEVLALALAALGLTGEVAARVFILGEPVIGRSVSAVRRLTLLVETVAPAAARRMLTAMLEGPAVERRPAPQRVAATRRGEAAEAPAARRDATLPAVQRRQAS